MTLIILKYLLSLALVAFLVYLISYKYTKDTKQSLKQTATTMGWLLFTLPFSLTTPMVITNGQKVVNRPLNA